MSRKGWTLLALFQTIGLLCFLVGPHVVHGGAEMFLIGFVLLLPGSVAAVAITEKLLWGALGLKGMTIAEVVLALIINLLVWFACAKALNSWRSRKGSQGTVQL